MGCAKKCIIIIVFYVTCKIMHIKLNENNDEYVIYAKQL